MTIPIGILTVSDRASQGIYEDQSGPAIKSWLEHTLDVAFTCHTMLVPDTQEDIVGALLDLADVSQCTLILTTGGTGPAPRDVTPEATERMCDRMLPGFGELMRAASLKSVPTAILSRQTAGIRGRSLIINLPGKPAAVQECLDAVFAAVPYCLDLIGGDRLETHPERCEAFRPRSSST